MSPRRWGVVVGQPRGGWDTSGEWARRKAGTWVVCVDGSEDPQLFFTKSDAERYARACEAGNQHWSYAAKEYVES